LQLAREVERAGFHALYAADHPGSAPSPFVALAAAAAVTERIRLGPCVVNAGMWEPLALAGEVATLDVVSDGRAVLGVGAGHTPEEWTATGRAYPPAGERVVRMVEVVEATRALLEGRTTNYAGRFVTLVDAILDAPKPVQHHIPLLVGGNGGRVLRFAARSADVVGITGLARTLADGHRHEVDWSPDALRQQLESIASDAREANRNPEIEALVQVVAITDDAVSVAERVAGLVPGASTEGLLHSPFAWIGSTRAISDNLEQFAACGIRNFVIRADAMPDACRVMDART
jgi:probable F420-dependent oxidoreductase